MTLSGQIRLLLADDHTLLREALRRVLDNEVDMEIVAEASTGRQAVELAEILHPDLVLMDIGMPEMDGLEATRLITKRLPETRVVILTGHEQDEHAFQAVKAGARGYLLKSIDLNGLMRSIRAVHAGHTLVSADVAMRVLEEFRQLPRTRSGRGAIDLSDREKDVLKLLAEGASNQEIARRLCLSEKTIESRLSVIFQKLQINNRVQAALYALRTGLAPLQPSDDGSDTAPFDIARGSASDEGFDIQMKVNRT